MTVMAVEDICEFSDLPKWLCCHCPEFASTPRPVPPEPTRPIAGYWSIEWEGRAGYSRKWHGLTTDPGKPPKPTRIYCNHDADQPLCHDCTQDLAAVLDDIPDLLYQLHLAEIRDTQFVEHGAAADADGNLNAGGRPWNERAAKARAQLADVLYTVGGATQQAGPTASQTARQIRAHLGRLARRQDMPEYASRISTAAAHAHAVIDRPSRPWYYGRCPKCGQHLYAERATDPATIITCRQDGCTYAARLDDHQRAQLHAGEDRWLTEDELVGAIAKAGDDEETVTREQIRRWFKSEGLPRETRERPKLVDGRIVVETVDVFRLGDVLAYARGERVPTGTQTAAEVAVLFGVTEAAVWQWVRRGVLEPVARRKKPLRFRNEDVDRLRIARSDARDGEGAPEYPDGLQGPQT